MSSFEFVSVLVSVIVGLAITNLLTGLGRAIHHRKQARLWWVHIVWTGSIFLFLTLHWWGLFSMRNETSWSYWVFLYILVHSVLLFLLTVLLYPPDAIGRPEQREVFETNRSWFLGAFALSLLADIGTSALQGGLWTPRYYLPLVLHLVVIAGIGAIFPAPRYQQLLAVYIFGGLLGWGVIVRKVLLP